MSPNKPGGNDTKTFDAKIVAMFDKLLKNYCVTPTKSEKTVI